MPEVLDWQRDDPRLVVERAAQELTAGNLVVIPTDTGYHFAASALHAEAVAALGRLRPAENAVLAVAALGDAQSWVPWMSTTARRLARRVWPGPVTIVIDCQTSAAVVPSFASADGTVRTRIPAHEAPLEVLAQLDGPLLMTPVPPGTSSIADMFSALPGQVTLVISDGSATALLVPTAVQVQGDKWTVTQAGSVTAEMLQTLMLTTVLFVCTGNTCRSPMAEAFCKKLLADRLGCKPQELARHGFLVLSAGLAAMMGREATPEAVLVAKEYGADLGGHQSQPLSAELLARADYLFTMTESHLRALLPFCQDWSPRPRLLASNGQDVPDPIGAELQVYRECAQQVFRYLQECLPDIQLL
jgi:L-threonylcarbamoyladenylate synthase